MARRPVSVLRETDAEARRLAQTLLHGARHGALAVIEPESGFPMASRVGVATDVDSTPLVLISALAAHTGTLVSDPRCSILLGEPGSGDPLAHARISLTCLARRLDRTSPEGERAARRYLNRNPKARLYAGLGDFDFWRLEIERASLNGGFGRAYALARQDIVLEGPAVLALADAEPSAIEHMNTEHSDAVGLIARHLAGAKGRSWTISGIDVQGMDMIAGDDVCRVHFPRPLDRPDTLRSMLIRMTRLAREADLQQGRR